MGLDMYLTAKKSVYYKEDFSGANKELFEQLNVAINPPYRNAEVSAIEYRMMYWRKANAIHNWFVKNVQDGEDDCGEYYVETSQLEDLLDTINKVLEDNSLVQELLPPTSGFFFGSTEIDEWYWETLKETKKKLEEILPQIKEDFISIYYESSW